MGRGQYLCRGRIFERDCGSCAAIGCAICRGAAEAGEGRAARPCQHALNGRVRRCAPLERVEQFAQGHLGFAAQNEIERREGAHGLKRQRRYVRAHGHGDGAQRLGQEDAVHVVAQGRRGDLRQVVARAALLQQLLKFGPAHAQRHAVHNLHCVLGQQNGGHLRHLHLRPDHVLAAAAANAMLAADPDRAVGRGRVDEQHLNSALDAVGGGERLHLGAGVGKVGCAYGRHAPAAQVLANLVAQCL